MTFGLDVTRRAFSIITKLQLNFSPRFSHLLYKNPRMNPYCFIFEWFHEDLFKNSCFIPEFECYLEICMTLIQHMSHFSDLDCVLKFVCIYCNICLFLAILYSYSGILYGFLM